MLQLVTVSVYGTPQFILFSSLLSRENASLERRFGALNAIASNINGFDIKGKLNEIYDKYKGPLWGKVNDPNNYGQIIAEISSTQPGSSKVNTYTVPGSGITHIMSDSTSSVSASASATTGVTDVAQSKGSLPIGGKAGDLTTSSSNVSKSSTSLSEKRSPNRGRSVKKNRSRRHRSRHHSHHRHHHHPSSSSSHSSRHPYFNSYRGHSSYDPYYSSGSSLAYSRHQPHLPPTPPHPSIISSSYLHPQVHTSTSFSNVPPAILGAQIGAALTQSQQPHAGQLSSPHHQSPSSTTILGSHESTVNQNSHSISNGLSSITSPGQTTVFPYSSVAALSGLPAVNPLLNNNAYALLLNQLALASSITTTTTPSPPVTTTKKVKSKKSSKKDSSNKTVALTTSINTDDGTISIGGIDPENVIKFVGGVVQSTGLNKALGSAFSTVMTTVSKVGSQVVKQAVHSISDSVTFSLGQNNGQIGTSTVTRGSKRRKSSLIENNTGHKIASSLFQLRNQQSGLSDETSEVNTDEQQDENDGGQDSTVTSSEGEVEDGKDDVESEERVKRDKESSIDDTSNNDDEIDSPIVSSKLTQKVKKKKRVNRIRINRLKAGQVKNHNDSNVRTLTLGGTNISLRNTEKGGFSISIGEPNSLGDRRKDQGFPKDDSNISTTISSISSS